MCPFSIVQHKHKHRDVSEERLLEEAKAFLRKSELVVLKLRRGELVNRSS